MMQQGPSGGSVYPRCGCRDEQGRQLGVGCPRLGDPGHGSWSFEVRVPGPRVRQRVRRGGFATEQEALRALVEYGRRDGVSRACGAWTTGRWLGSG
jgi:hypothetical protein